jgi:hypothetical protein
VSDMKSVLLAGRKAGAGGVMVRSTGSSSGVGREVDAIRACAGSWVAGGGGEMLRGFLCVFCPGLLEDRSRERFLPLAGGLILGV